VKQHDIVTDQVWGTAISGEYESGQLISETCEIRITVSVSMDEPAWKVLSFEDALEQKGTITERRVKGSFRAPINYTDSGIPTSGGLTPPAEDQKTHTGYYTVVFDITEKIRNP
jgi:hypothetical protein